MLYVCSQAMKGDAAEKDYMPGDIHSHRTLQLFVLWTSPMSDQGTLTVQSRSLSIAGRHMKALSERQLTYGSDGLNAILGILDHLSCDARDLVYYIWGVPFAACRRERQNASEETKVSYKTALNW